MNKYTISDNRDNFFLSTPDPVPDRPKIKFGSWQTIDPPERPKELAPPAIYHLYPATRDKTLINRAESKLRANALAEQLIALNSPLKNKYETTLDCSRVLIKKGKKITSTYCSCKWCEVCNRIRTGRLINKYEMLSAWLPDPQFITLTVQNIHRYDYDSDISFIQDMRWIQKRMYKFFRKIQDRFRKRGIPIKGIRAFENIVSKNGKGVHPHIHWQIDGTFTLMDFTAMWHKDKLNKIDGMLLADMYNRGEITAGKLKGELIIALWMKHFPGEQTDRQGQQVKSCTANTTKELFKYQTKLSIKTDDTGPRIVPIRMLDMIFQATKGVKAIVITGFLTRPPRADYLKIKDAEEKREAFEIFSAKFTEYRLYAELTKALCTDVLEDLKAQEMELSENLSVDIETGEIVETPEPDIEVFNWRGDNWYSGENQKVVDFKIPNKARKFIASFNSS